LDFDVLPLADLIAFDDLGGIDLIAGFGIDLLVLDPIAGLFVDLMEADLLPLGGRRIEGDRTRGEGELDVAFPIRTRGHGLTPKRNNDLPPDMQCKTRWSPGAGAICLCLAVPCLFSATGQRAAADTPRSKAKAASALRDG
jgi:hypothetical protein